MSMVMYLRRANEDDIARLRAAPDSRDDFVFGDDAGENDLVDFDTAWHVLHFLLVGTADVTEDPLGIIVGNEPVEGTDGHGFGGFSVIAPDRMATFASALAALGDDTLAGRWDRAGVLPADLYGADRLGDDADDRHYIFQGVPALRRFAATCAAAGDGALRVLS